MKKIYFLIITLAIITFYSCGNDEEDVTINENLVYTVFDVTNGNGIFFNVMTQAGSESFTANSNSFSFTTNTFSATALSGTTFYYMMQLYNYDISTYNGCVDVSAKTYLNNNLYENRSYSIGFYNNNVCENSTGISEMYGIIAD